MPCTCGGIQPVWVEPASPIELTTSQKDALLARRPCASTLETFATPIFYRAQPKTRGPDRGSRCASTMVVHVFGLPSVNLRHVQGFVGRSRSFITSPPGRLAAWPEQRGLVGTNWVGMLVRRRQFRSSAVCTQTLHPSYRMRRILSLSKTYNIILSATRSGYVSQP